jgi:hypothetical protein
MDFASVARAAKAKVVAARGSGARAAPSLPPPRAAPNQSSIDLALSKGRGKAEPTELWYIPYTAAARGIHTLKIRNCVR